LKKRSFKKPVKLFDKELPKSIPAMGGFTYNISFRMRSMGFRTIYLCPMTPYHIAAIRAARRKL